MAAQLLEGHQSGCGAAHGGDFQGKLGRSYWEGSMGWLGSRQRSRLWEVCFMYSVNRLADEKWLLLDC